MGMIRIEVAGSFRPSAGKSFSAMGGGHARAVADAIAWLAAEVLPDAVMNDHLCQRDGAYPHDRFGLSIPPAEAGTTEESK